jgi:hypothetical protein
LRGQHCTLITKPQATIWHILFFFQYRDNTWPVVKRTAMEYMLKQWNKIPDVTQHLCKQIAVGWIMLTNYPLQFFF